MNIICEIIVGSNLYGTNNSYSDLDIKGVYLPEMRDLLNGIHKKSIDNSTNKQKRKNTNKDIDKQYFSIQHFLRLLYKGEVICFDMIHANNENILYSSDVWYELMSNKDKLYSKNLKGFLGFVMGQTRKYSNRGKRYNCVNDVCRFLLKYDPNVKIKDIWNVLPLNEYACYSKDSKGCDVYSVCERMVHPSVNVGYALRVFNGYKTQYGNRAKKAADKGGYDLKAISHAMRILYQLEEMLDTKNIIFPLKYKNRILNIKNGNEIINDSIFDEMENRILECKKKIERSSFPDYIDMEWWKDWIYNLYI